MHCWNVFALVVSCLAIFAHTDSEIRQQNTADTASFVPPEFVSSFSSLFWEGRDLVEDTLPVNQRLWTWGIFRTCSVASHRSKRRSVGLGRVEVKIRVKCLLSSCLVEKHHTKCAVNKIQLWKWNVIEWFSTLWQQTVAWDLILLKISEGCHTTANLPLLPKG